MKTFEFGLTREDDERKKLLGKQKHEMIYNIIKLLLSVKDQNIIHM